MGEQPPGSLANAAEIDQPLLVAIVLQCRGVLGRKDRRFQPAAVKTAASWCRSRICSIVILSFESSRTFRSTAPGEITGSDAPGACSHARPISTTRSRRRPSGWAPHRGRVRISRQVRRRTKPGSRHGAARQPTTNGLIHTDFGATTRRGGGGPEVRATQHFQPAAR